ncbi:hypothetical protein KIW84_055209 [Lathyrus oleraceus]|uniref:Uncharacterized protein n=1 Tax=Pisum sativum TaxID=3888 RepID=A0A9D5AJH1_PEA|nr:hypothetical protein KIW84_055209 [Pisum sativum]
MSTKLNQCIYEPIHLLPKYIQTNGQILGAAEFDNTFGWNNKHVGARILLSKEFLVQNVKSFHDYKGHSDNFVCSLIPGAGSSSAQYTPGGLLFKIRDSNMQTVPLLPHLHHRNPTFSPPKTSINAAHPPPFVTFTIHRKYNPHHHKPDQRSSPFTKTTAHLPHPQNHLPPPISSIFIIEFRQTKNRQLQPRNESSQPHLLTSATTPSLNQSDTGESRRSHRDQQQLQPRESLIPPRIPVTSPTPASSFRRYRRAFPFPSATISDEVRLPP